MAALHAMPITLKFNAAIFESFADPQSKTLIEINPDQPTLT